MRVILAGLVLLFAAPVVAADGLAFTYAEATFDGVNDFQGDLVGARILSTGQAPLGQFTLDAESIAVEWYNLSAPSVARVGLNPTRDHDQQTFSGAHAQGQGTAAELDFLVAAIDGRAPPRLSLSADEVRLTPPAQAQLQEEPYVDSTRPVLSAPTMGTQQASWTSDKGIEITGDFAVSIWAWNFTVQANEQQRQFITGAHHVDVQRDPVNGQEIAYTAFEQVAQLRVTNGRLLIPNLAPVSWQMYVRQGDVTGSQSASFLGATGTSITNQVFTNTTLEASGTYAIAFDARQVPSFGEIDYLQGTVLAGGQQLDLVPPPVPEPAQPDPDTQVATPRGSNWMPELAIGLSIAGLIFVAVVLHGPMQTIRFNRLVRRFDEKDYTAFLQGVEPFARNGRFARRARFLKAVSLLSLGEHREAELYLETLAHDGPDPATKRFLQACAAAAQGQDDVAIGHLTECLRIDPSYMEQAQGVPALQGYLPFFSIEAAGA